MNIANSIKGLTKVFKTTAVRKFGKAAFKIQKAAPKIAVYGGAAGTAVAGIWAVKKTLSHAEELVNEINNDIHVAKATDSGIPGIAKAYIKGAWKFTKFYSGPIIVEGASVAAILWGFDIVDGRLVAMTAAAASLETLNKNQMNYLKEYRSALAEKYGENFDEDLHVQYEADIPECGDAKKTVTYVDENGEEHEEEVTRVISDSDGNGIKMKVGDSVISPYAVIFDETSTEWSTDPEYNKMTLIRIRQTCDDLLHARGYLFLNEVYQELGLPATRVGQMVGWLNDGTGDGYVDFGIYNIQDVPNRSEFINGFEPSIILDFNVDGVIWDKI